MEVNERKYIRAWYEKKKESDPEWCEREREKKPYYLKVKVNGKQVYKHRYVYEQYHGKIPEGCCVCFLDGDNRNFDINNLYAIPIRAISVTNITKHYKRRKDETAEDFKKKLEKIEVQSKKIDEWTGNKNRKGVVPHRFYVETDPEFREKMRKRGKLYYAERKDDIKFRINERYANDPEYSARKKERNRLYLAKKKKDPEFCKKIKEYLRLYNAEKRKDPEYRKKRNEYLRLYNAEKRKDPEWCEKRREYMREYCAKRRAMR